MQAVSKSLLEMIILQEMRRSVVAQQTDAVLVVERRGQVPNWAVLSNDTALQIIVAELQQRYCLDHQYVRPPKAG
jgi:hypothetical protein